MVLNLMATTAGSVVEKKVALANEKNGDMGNEWLKTHSASCGAYKLISWKANESVTLEGLPSYRFPPKTKRVIVRHVPEPGTQRLLLEKGDIDMAWSLQPDQLKPLAGNKDVKVETFPYSGTWQHQHEHERRAAQEPEGAHGAALPRRLPGHGGHSPQGLVHRAPDLSADRVPERDRLQPLQAWHSPRPRRCSPRPAILMVSRSSSNRQTTHH